MYETHFNLSRKPFRLSPDVKFFYASKIHKNALAYLEYGLDQNEGFLILTGDPGTGKTTLLHKIEQTLSRQFCIARVDVSPAMETLELLRLIAISFGIKNVQDSGESGVVDKIKEFLSLHLHYNHRAIIFVDECHHLSYKSLESLRLLTNIQHRELPIIQCFLVGQSSFRDQIRAPELEQLSQRVIAICHLETLCEQETIDYIKHRLTTAGHPVANLFSTTASKIIHKFTSGNPRRINRICDRALLYASIEENQHIDKRIICDVIEELSAEMEIEFDVSLYRSMIEKTEYKEVVPEATSVICQDTKRSSTPNLRPTKAKAIAYPLLVDKVPSNLIDDDSHILSTENITQDTNIALQTYEPQHETQHETQEVKQRSFRLHLITSIGILFVAIPAIFMATSSPDEMGLPWNTSFDFSPNTGNIANNNEFSPPTPLQTINPLQQIENETVLKSNAPNIEEVDLNNNNNNNNPDVVSFIDDSHAINTNEKQLLALKEENDIEFVMANQLAPQKESRMKTIKVSSTEFPALLPNVNKEILKSPNAEKTHAKPIKSTSKLATSPRPDTEQHKLEKITKISSKDIKVEGEKTLLKIAKKLPSKELEQVAVNKAALPVTTPISQSASSKQEKKVNDFEPVNLYKVINKFTGAYKGGDMNSLSSVLSKDIKTDDSNNRDSLTAQYEKLFNITDDRELKLMNVSWKTDTEKAAGEGRFEATILEKGRTKPQTYAGTFTMSIEIRNTQLAITDMRYAYQ